MFKRCKVVQLSTNQKAPIFLWYLDGIENGLASLGLTLGREMYPSYKPQHLYILSDDRVKKNDWFLRTTLFTGVPIDGVPTKANEFVEASQTYFGDHTMKIIASTDPFLNLSEPKLFDHNVWWTGRDSIMYFPCLSDAHTYWRKHKMPSPSESFLERYVTEYNKGNSHIIKEVMVEYEYEPGYRVEGDPAIIGSKPKVNSDNTITIKKVKNNWTRDEVRMALTYCVAEITSHPKTTSESMKEWQDKVDKWVETNL